MARLKKSFFYLNVLAMTISLSILTSCGQLSSLQTARVLDEGQVNVGGAVIGYGIQDPDAGGGELGSGIFPHVEVLGRFGIAESMDLGVKLSTGGNLLFDVKYQLVGDAFSEFAVSIGGGLEYQGSNPTENIILRGHLPVYLSYHPTDNDAVYLSPRYIYQYLSNDDNSFFLGTSFGYSHQFSDRFTGLIETSIYKPSTENTTNGSLFLYQFGLGAVFHLNL